MRRIWGNTHVDITSVVSMVEGPLTAVAYSLRWYSLRDVIANVVIITLAAMILVVSVVSGDARPISHVVRTPRS